MNKTILKTMVCMLCLPLALKAQLSPKVKEQYSAVITAKVYQVAELIKLPENRQFVLADYYKKQDSLGAVALTTNASIKEVNSYYNFYPKAILNAEEWNNYLLATTGSSLKLRYAIKYRDDLKLNQQQVDNILLVIKGAAFKMMDANFNFIKFDGDNLTKILSPTQNKQLLNIFYHDKAKQFASENYKRATTFNLITLTDSTKKINEFYEYELSRLIKLDMVRYSGNVNKIDSVKRALEINKPIILWKANALAKKLPQAKLPDLINYRKKLALTEIQIDTLIRRIVELENIKLYERINNPYGYYDTKPYETQSMLRILTKSQLESYLTLINQDRALFSTQKNWQQLKNLKLVNAADSLTINEEHYAYELKFLVASQLLKMEKSQKNAFNKLAVQNTKPVLLKKLDALATDKAAINNTKKQLTW